MQKTYEQFTKEFLTKMILVAIFGFLAIWLGEHKILVALAFLIGVTGVSYLITFVMKPRIKKKRGCRNE